MYAYMEGREGPGRGMGEAEAKAYSGGCHCEGFSKRCSFEAERRRTVAKG